jgi:hypothetical protein
MSLSLDLSGDLADRVVKIAARKPRNIYMCARRWWQHSVENKMLSPIWKAENRIQRNLSTTNSFPFLFLGIYSSIRLYKIHGLLSDTHIHTQQEEARLPWMGSKKKFSWPYTSICELIGGVTEHRMLSCPHTSIIHRFSLVRNPNQTQSGRGKRS